MLEQYERLIGKQAAQVFVDSGYKGLTKYKNSQINVPKPDKNISRDKRKKHSKGPLLNRSSNIWKEIPFIP